MPKDDFDEILNEEELDRLLHDLEKYDDAGDAPPDATQKFSKDDFATGAPLGEPEGPDIREYSAKPREKRPEPAGRPSPPPDRFAAAYSKDSKRRRKRSGCSGAVLYAVFIIAISCVLAALGWIIASDMLALSKEEKEVLVTIAEDDTIPVIADKLKEAGLIEYKAAFRLFASFARADEKIEPGEYTLKTTYDYNALIRYMRHTSSLGDIVKLSFPEGYNMDQIFALLEENNVADVDELKEAAATYEYEYYFLEGVEYGDPYRLEGFLFPDTYQFYENENPENVISRFLKNFEVRFTEELRAQAEERGLSVRDVITVASMIEKEAANDAERYTISSVIFNRLADDMNLQIDATVIYALKDAYTGTITQDDLTTDSPYNTYVYPGLPAGPICSPSLISIKAALNPSDTNYYYYALNKQGTHSFFKNFDEHNNFVNSDEYGGQ